MSKIIVSDTSCLIALSNIGSVNLLRDLYTEVIITPEVEDEFGDTLPDWIIVEKVKNSELQDEIGLKLDKGEASSIALAIEMKESVLIIDELKGRTVAKSFNVEIIGTIGIIILANKRGLLKDVMSTIQNLVNNGFRLSDKLLKDLDEKYRNV